MKKFATVISAVVTTAIATATVAGAEEQIGNGNTTQTGGGTSFNNGNHSVSVSIVNGVATVIVDGVQLYGDEAQPYIDAARSKHRRR